MTIEHITTLTASGESETLEFKETTGTRREVLARLDPGVSERQVRRALEELKDSGLVVSPGRGRSGRWKHAAEA